MIACILAIAVLNIGLGFALAVYLVRPHGVEMVGDEQGEAIDGASAAPLHGGAVASRQTVGPGVPGGSFPGGDLGVVPQTVEGLKARVQQCNEYLSDLGSQVAGSPGGR